MKITLVTPPLQGHALRGTGIYTQKLYDALSKQSGITVDIVDIDHIPETTDIYHFPYFDPFFLTLPAHLPRPSVITIHDVIPLIFSKHFPVGLKGTYRLWKQKQRLNQSDGIITDSKQSQLDIHSALGYPIQQIYPIHLSADEAFFKQPPMAKLNIVKSKYGLPEKFVLYVGDVNWNKNIPQVIGATQKSNVPLVIVSQSFSLLPKKKYHPWEKSLEKAQKIAMKNISNIIVLNKLPTEDLASLYRLATVLFFPSYYEGFGLPVIEAFASGCPVITTNRGSLREIIGNAALTVDPDNENECAQAISHVFNNHKYRNDLISKGITQAKTFSWEKTAELTIKVYNTVIHSYAKAY